MTLREVIGNPSLKDLRVFSVLLAVFLAVIAWFTRERMPRVEVLLATAVLVAAVGLSRPRWMRPVYVAWMTAVFPIGWTVSHLALAMVYYLVLTPIGLWRRAVAGDPMQRQLDRNAATSWRNRPPPPDPERYFRQF